MTGASLLPARAAHFAAFLICFAGWMAMLEALIRAGSFALAEIRARRVLPFPWAIAEILAGGFVLVQIGVTAGTILLNMMGN